MKPDSRKDGMKRNMVSCIACIWLRATVENKKPSARLTTMKRALAMMKASGLPRNGTPNKKRAPASMMATCREPTKT